MQELDAITLKRASKGDHRAFKRLYDHYAPFIWKVLFPLANGDTTIAGELTQTTFVKVYRSAGGFRGGAAFSTWIYRIAYTTALQYLKRRHQTTLPAVDPDLLDGTEQADSYDNRELVSRILVTLTPEDRFLLVAREVDALSFDELSTITGKNAGALRTRLHRIKEGIRSSFHQEKSVAAGAHYAYQ